MGGRGVTAALFLAGLLGSWLMPSTAALGDDYGASVSAIDNVFDPAVVRIQPGQSALPGPAGGVGPEREPPPGGFAPTIRVPQQAPTIQSAVDRTRPGGMVLVSPGVYEESVTVTTPYLTIRGTDRNQVIVDGGLRAPWASMSSRPRATWRRPASLPRSNW